MRNSKKISQIYPYSFLVPGTLLYMALFILPVCFTVYYSFRNWDLFTSNYIGFDNFVNLLTDPELNIAFKNTLVFAIVTTIGKCVLGLILAVFLNNQFKVTNFLRTIFFLPAVLSTITVGIVFSALLHPEVGLINIFLRSLGLGFLAQDWLTNIHLAIYSVSFVEIWKWTGFTMVIFLGALQSISREYYEAAEIDGASKTKQFTNITIPLIMPAINNAVVISLIGGIGVFDIVAVLTNGGPGNATQVFGTVIFKSFGMGLQGEACAAQIIMSVLIMAVSLFTYSVIRKKEVTL